MPLKVPTLAKKASCVLLSGRQRSLKSASAVAPRADVAAFCSIDVAFFAIDAASPASRDALRSNADVFSVITAAMFAARVFGSVNLLQSTLEICTVTNEILIRTVVKGDFPAWKTL